VIYLLSHIEDYPQVKLAKYGYIPERKLENKLKNHAIFWPHHGTYCPNMMIFIKKIKKSLKSGQFGTLFSKILSMSDIEFCFFVAMQRISLSKRKAA
jgi:hypothetical protein